MNTIPSTFNERQISRTLLGGSEKPSPVRIEAGCIILSRGNCQYKARVIESVLSHGFSEVIYIERASSSRGDDELFKLYPTVKFIALLDDNVTQGDMLNVAMAESKRDHVLVVQEDMCSEGPFFSQSLEKSLTEKNKFCWCPRLSASGLKNVPVHFVPGVNKSFFSVDVILSASEGDSTLYAADFAGFYDRKKFIQLGGIDWTIKSVYWQKIDLFFRAWLWGESVGISSAFSLQYDAESPEEDRGTDYSYLRFYLKNLLPVFSSDHAFIPRTSFLAFKSSSSCSLSDALRLFREGRRWTEVNKYRFKQDAKMLIENWTDK